MRPRPHRIGLAALILAGLSASLAGCSTGTDSLSTASLGPRPETGMVGADGYYGQPYALPPDRRYAARQYTDPGSPTPRQYASAPYEPGYGYDRNIQTGSIAQNRGGYDGAYASDPNWRWRQGGYPSRWSQPAPITTGSLGAGTNVVIVREGDTLFGIARRYNIPVGDLAAANRLTSERIEVGQQLVVPARYR